MSQLSDIRLTVSGKTLRNKLTLKERAELLCDIVDNLDYDTYDKVDENGQFIDYNIDKAMEDLKEVEKEAIKNGW